MSRAIEDLGWNGWEWEGVTSTRPTDKQLRRTYKQRLKDQNKRAQRKRRKQQRKAAVLRKKNGG